MNFDAVLFDCDGVLVDSEPITNGVLRDMLEALGWKLSPQECMRIFVGKAVKDEAALIEARTGQPLTEDWLVRFRERRNVGLAAGTTVFGYSPAKAGHDAPAALGGAGALAVFTDMAALHELMSEFIR